MSSVPSCPLCKQPRRMREGKVSQDSTSKSYFIADLIGASSWQKQLLSRFLCHLVPQLSALNQSRNTFRRAKGDRLCYVQWLHQRRRHGSGPKQRLPQADPPPPAAGEQGTRNSLPHSDHQQHLSAAGDHSQTPLTSFTAATGISRVFL